MSPFLRWESQDSKSEVTFPGPHSCQGEIGAGLNTDSCFQPLPPHFPPCMTIVLPSMELLHGQPPHLCTADTIYAWDTDCCIPCHLSPRFEFDDWSALIRIRVTTAWNSDRHLLKNKCLPTWPHSQCWSENYCVWIPTGALRMKASQNSQAGHSCTQC